MGITKPHNEFWKQLIILTSGGSKTYVKTKLCTLRMCVTFLKRMAQWLKRCAVLAGDLSLVLSNHIR